MRGGRLVRRRILDIANTPVFASMGDMFRPAKPLRRFGRGHMGGREDKWFTTPGDRIRQDRPPASTVPLSGGGLALARASRQKISALNQTYGANTIAFATPSVGLRETWRQWRRVSFQSRAQAMRTHRQARPTPRGSGKRDPQGGLSSPRRRCAPAFRGAGVPGTCALSPAKRRGVQGRRELKELCPALPPSGALGT